MHCHILCDFVFGSFDAYTNGPTQSCFVLRLLSSLSESSVGRIANHQIHYSKIYVHFFFQIKNLASPIYLSLHALICTLGCYVTITDLNSYSNCQMSLDPHENFVLDLICCLNEHFCCELRI